MTLDRKGRTQGGERQWKGVEEVMGWDYMREGREYLEK